MHRKQFYQSQQAFLDGVSDDTRFKRSTFKKKAEWAMVTTNLHIQVSSVVCAACLDLTLACPLC